MFGLDKKFKEAHVLSHLEDAAIGWLLMPGNPILAQVPAGSRPAIVSELQAIQASAKQAESAPVSIPPSSPSAPSS